MTTLKAAICWSSLCFFLCICSGVTWGQPVSTNASSLEWVAIHSPTIVRGVIEDVELHQLQDGLGSDRGPNHYQTATVRVIETLKGRHSDRLQFVHSGLFLSDSVSDLAKEKTELLLFLEPWTYSDFFKRSSDGYAYTRCENVVQEAVILDPKDVRWGYSSVPVISRNLERISTPKQAIDTLKTYLKKYHDERPLHRGTSLLPAELSGGNLQVLFVYPEHADGKYGAVNRQPAKPSVIDFEVFKNKYAGEPPEETSASYSSPRRDTLGLMVADCDVIVRGVIEESAFYAKSHGVTGDTYGVKLAVVESIRGETEKQITCLLRDVGDISKLQRDRQELVLFLRRRPDLALEYQARTKLWNDSAIVLNDQSVEVLFSDLTWHRNPQEILTRLRQVAAPLNAEDDEVASQPTTPGYEIPPIFRDQLPSSIAAESAVEGNPVSNVSLPVNQELQKNARLWAKSQNKDRRWLAARAMIYFKSDENAAILQRMLHDDATWDRWDMLSMTRLEYPYEPKYLVRWEAWHVLYGWGYDVPKPEFGSNPFPPR